LRIKFIKAAFALVLLISVTACERQEKFDTEKWLVKVDMDYPYRDLMIDDLVNNRQIKGLQYQELVKLLGEPQRNWQADSNQYYYQIVEDYGMDIDPVYTKNLMIQLQDSVVTEFKVQEWKK